MHNLEPFVAAAIESVLRQDSPAYQIIVVDDASTDRSADIISRFADRVDIIRLPENRGVLRAMLAGIAVSTGDILYFLDGDDEWLPGKLRRVGNVFSANPKAVFCSHDYAYCDAAGRPLAWLDDTQNWFTRSQSEEEVDRSMRDSVLTYAGLVWLGSAFSVRRAALQWAAFEAWTETLFDPAVVYQDHPLAIFAALTCRGSFVYVDEVLMRYRIHAANSSGASSMLSSAQRTAQKAQATHRATLALVEKFAPERSDVLARQKALLREDELRIALYGGRPLRAAKLLFEMPWLSSPFVKEAVRLFAFAGLGERSFFALKKRLASLRLWLRRR